MTWRAGWYVDCAPRSYIVKSSGGALAAGKYYFEVTITSGGADGTNGYGILVGVCTSTAVLTGICITALNAAQANQAGAAFFNSRANNPFSAANGWGYPNQIGDIPVEAVGTTAVYGVCLDTINHKLWFRNITDASPAAGKFAGGTNPDGEPQNNLYGADISASGPSPITGSVFIMVGASHGSGSAKGAGTVNFGASAFTGTPPTGFVSIYSVYPGAALNPADNSNLTLSNGNLSFDGTNVPVSFSPPISGFSTNVGFSNACRSNFAIAQA